MKSLLSFLILTCCIMNTHQAQSFFSTNPLVHTYSIVAIDSETGEMGVAVQSHWFQVGPIVAWGKAGVGVVATQSFVDPAYGPKGLALMEQGVPADDALRILLEQDEGEAFRQIAFMDKDGQVSAHSGSKCIESAGDHQGATYSVQANMMLNDDVVPAMAKAFENSSGPLAERLMLALEAAQNAGGDIRGKQSAALLVVKAESNGNVWQDNLVDLRIDDHPEPLKELRRILTVHRAYEHMNAGDVAVEHNEMEEAMNQYGSAMEMFPNNEEMKYWTAITLANTGDLEKALPMFKEVFAMNENWRTLTPRLITNEMLTVDEETLEKIMKQ